MQQRRSANLYLDKQIDKQSTLFHYQAEKLTTSSGSESRAAVEKSRDGEEEEENNMNSKLIWEQTLYTGTLLTEDELGGNY